MGWFNIWWQGLGLVGQIMACAAIPMTIVMFLQLILMLIGVGFGNDSDSDFDSDSADFDAGTDIDFDADADMDAGFDTGFDADFDADTDIDLDAGAVLDPIADAAIEDVGGPEAAAHDIGHHQSALKLITVRGIVAFFALGGWAGLAALTTGLSALMSVMIALLSGVAAMVVASAVIRFALKMQSSGNISIRNAVAQTAEVYITIPPSRSNTGKVTMVLQERFVELDAVTDSEFAIKPKTIVEIVGVSGKDCLVVSRLPEEMEE